MLELRPHQRKAVDELKNGSVLAGGVGSGKTVVALAYYYEKVLGGVIGDLGSVHTPVDLYVITTAKKRDTLDWDSDAARLGLVRERPDLSPGGIRIVIDSWNNIEKYEEVENAFFVFDEQRAVGAGQWSKSFVHIARHNQWILLSATPGDTWLDYIPVFLANGFYKNRTEFKRTHVVYNTFTKYPKVDHYVGLGRLVRNRNAVLVEMPYERHTVRHVHKLTVDYDHDLYDKVVKRRWHVYEQRPLRDVAELFSVMRKVVNSDSSRIRAIRTLMRDHPKLIVFYNFDYELELLRTLAEPASSPSQSSTRTKPSSSEKLTILSSPSSRTPGSTASPSSPNRLTPAGSSTDFAVAEWNGHKHQPIPKTDRWVYLVQYVAGSEGWNCIDTDAVVFYSQTYSYKNHEQGMGRIDRLNTPFTDLHYYRFVSDSPIDRAIDRSLDGKHDFNQLAFAAKSRY